MVTVKRLVVERGELEGPHGCFLVVVVVIVVKGGGDGEKD